MNKEWRNYGFSIRIKRLLIREEMKKQNSILKNGVMLKLGWKLKFKERKNIRMLELILRKQEDLLEKTGYLRTLIIETIHYLKSLLLTAKITEKRKQIKLLKR